MSDYERRQYRLMADRLESFENKSIKLKTLILDLEGLLGVLENVDVEWKRKFQHEWGRLEELYSCALVDQQELSKEDKDLIEKSINNLKLLISQKLTND